MLCVEWLGEAYKAVVGAVASLVVITVVGGFVANRVGGRLQKRKETMAVRTDLLDRTATVAQAMYAACGHASRMLSLPESDEHEVHVALDQAYLKFAPAAAAVETVLQARFGLRSSVEAPVTVGGEGNIDGVGVADRWHQVRDLVTVYYFHLRLGRAIPPSVVMRNSVGYGGRLHSGLRLREILPKEEDEAAIDKFRSTLRLAYEEKLALLSQSLIQDPVAID